MIDLRVSITNERLKGNDKNGNKTGKGNPDNKYLFVEVLNFLLIFTILHTMFRFDPQALLMSNN